LSTGAGLVKLTPVATEDVESISVVMTVMVVSNQENSVAIFKIKARKKD
jgi:hypothetical protein